VALGKGAVFSREFPARCSFLAVTLLSLLSLRVPRDFRSALLSNLVLGVSLLIFLYVGQEIPGAPGG